jgi:hypothetical protein
MIKSIANLFARPRTLEGEVPTVTGATSATLRDIGPRDEQECP